MKTNALYTFWAAGAALSLLLGACGGEDSSSPNDGSSQDVDDEGSEANDTESSQDDSSTSTQSECSASSECEMVVCDCDDGPVNFQGCNVVNGVGTCATESTCAGDFGACD